MFLSKTKFEFWSLLYFEFSGFVAIQIEFRCHLSFVTNWVLSFYMIIFKKKSFVTLWLFELSNSEFLSSVTILVKYCYYLSFVGENSLLLEIKKNMFIEKNGTVVLSAADLGPPQKKEQKTRWRASARAPRQEVGVVRPMTHLTSMLLPLRTPNNSLKIGIGFSARSLLALIAGAVCTAACAPPTWRAHGMSSKCASHARCGRPLALSSGGQPDLAPQTFILANSRCAGGRSLTSAGATMPEP